MVRSPYSQASRFNAQDLSVFFKVVIISRNTLKYLRMKLYDVWNLLQKKPGEWVGEGSGRWHRSKQPGNKLMTAEHR